MGYYPPPGAPGPGASSGEPDPGAPPDPNAVPPGYSDPSSGWLPPGWEGGPSGYDAPGYTPPGTPGGGGQLPPGYGPPGPPGGGQIPPGYPPPGTPGGWSGFSGSYGWGSGRRGRGVVGGSVLALIVIVIVIVFVIVSGSSGSSQATNLFNNSMTAAGNSSGVDYVSTWTGGGEPTATYSGVAGQNDGTQTATDPTDFGNEQFDVLLASNQTLYLEGNVAALEDELGVSASGAPALAGKWISLSTSDGPYSIEESGLTVSTEAGLGDFTATSSETVTSGGATLTEIDGTIASSSDSEGATVVMDVSPSTDLPTSEVITYSDGTVNTTTFTNWGTAPSVNVPATAVAWSTLTTSPPPDGYGSGETPSASAAATATATPTPTATPSASG